MSDKDVAQPKEPEGPSRENVGAMFDRIAKTYDFLNHLCSFGQDIRWRNKVVRRINQKPCPVILDLASGTADQLIAMVKKTSVERALGIDISYGMLSVGQEKVKRQNLDIHLIQGDAMALPLGDATVDAVSISFGIRNVRETHKGLAEMFRVLKPGGRAFILEFGLPPNILVRSGYLVYFRHILPLIGGLFSGDRAAYKYLNRTVETFPYDGEFCKLMEEAGFKEVSASPLCFGVAFIYEGIKSDDKKAE